MRLLVSGDLCRQRLEGWARAPPRTSVGLKASPAYAGTLAVALDQDEWPKIVGTIAGDDTVRVIAPDAENALAC